MQAAEAGATGMIARALVRALLERGDERGGQVAHPRLAPDVVG